MEEIDFEAVALKHIQENGLTEEQIEKLFPSDRITSAHEKILLSQIIYLNLKLEQLYTFVEQKAHDGDKNSQEFLEEFVGTRIIKFKG